MRVPLRSPSFNVCDVPDNARIRIIYMDTSIFECTKKENDIMNKLFRFPKGTLFGINLNPYTFPKIIRDHEVYEYKTNKNGNKETFSCYIEIDGVTSIKNPLIAEIQAIKYAVHECVKRLPDDVWNYFIIPKILNHIPIQADETTDDEIEKHRANSLTNNYTAILLQEFIRDSHIDPIVYDVQLMRSANKEYVDPIKNMKFMYHVSRFSIGFLINFESDTNEQIVEAPDASIYILSGFKRVSFPMYHVAENTWLCLLTETKFSSAIDVLSKCLDGTMIDFLRDNPNEFKNLQSGINYIPPTLDNHVYIEMHHKTINPYKFHISFLEYNFMLIGKNSASLRYYT